MFWMLISAWLIPFCLPVVTRQAAKISLPPPRLPPRHVQMQHTLSDGHTAPESSEFECKQSDRSTLDQSVESIRAADERNKESYPVKKRLRFEEPQNCDALSVPGKASNDLCSQKPISDDPLASLHISQRDQDEDIEKDHYTRAPERQLPFGHPGPSQAGVGIVKSGVVFDMAGTANFDEAGITQRVRSREAIEVTLSETSVGSGLIAAECGRSVHSTVSFNPSAACGLQPAGSARAPFPTIAPPCLQYAPPPPPPPPPRISLPPPPLPPARPSAPKLSPQYMATSFASLSAAATALNLQAALRDAGEITTPASCLLIFLPASFTFILDIWPDGLYRPPPVIGGPIAAQPRATQSIATAADVNSMQDPAPAPRHTYNLRSRSQTVASAPGPVPAVAHRPAATGRAFSTANSASGTAGTSGSSTASSGRWSAAPASTAELRVGAAGHSPSSAVHDTSHSCTCTRAQRLGDGSDDYLIQGWFGPREIAVWRGHLAHGSLRRLTHGCHCSPVGAGC